MYVIRMRSKAAKRAAALVVTVVLAANIFLSFNSLAEDGYYYHSDSFDHDPLEISRRLQGGKPRSSIRDRIVDSLRERRGIKPGDPDFQRLYLERLQAMRRKSALPAARRITLRTLDSTRQIWLRQDKELQNQLLETHQSNMSKNKEMLKYSEPMSVCGRPTNVGKGFDLALSEAGKMDKCPGANSNKLLMLQGEQKYGRTGNNLIEFLHSLQFAQDRDVTLGIMWNSWVLLELLPMFFPVQDQNEWHHHFETAFCVKIFYDGNDLKDWELVEFDNLAKIGEGRGAKGTNHGYLISKKMFGYLSTAPFYQYLSHQSKSLQTLFRNINTVRGRSMCTGIDAVFGADKKDEVYSVIHQRSLEGNEGLLKRMSGRFDIHPSAATDMRPEYIKSILQPLGMLEHPIVLITDGQNFDSVRRIVTDPEISPKLRLVPPEASWVGADITLAVMSNVFIGNPASTFSGFIAKSRLALGFGHSYLFRNLNEQGEWVTTCGDTCIFDKDVMSSMS